MDNILLKEEKNQYDNEQDQLLKMVLNYRFFAPWNNQSNLRCEGVSMQADSNLELFITNACNQNCEYCYLTKFPDLYPSHISNDTILNNLRILYDYILEQKFYIPEISMFSGEIWHTQLGLDVLDITYQYAEKGMGFGQIVIPSNCSFVANTVTLHKIQHYINKFNAINRPLKFSISIDGKYIDEQYRPRNNQQQYDDEFYNDVFAFAKHNSFCFHPMISSKNIQYWSENYKWWKKMNEYYQLDLYKMLMLEVRNNDWTQESIKQYCDFIVELADDFLANVCNNNIQLFANIMLMIRDAPIVVDGYAPWFLNPTDTFPSCTIATHLSVRLGDLAICPCHRTAYNKYLYGYFIVDNNKIIDIKAQNPQMAIKVYMSNIQATDPKCDTCLWNKYCMHGCLGSQLESMQDPFFPIECVCNFFHAKYSRLLTYYKEKGILDYLKTINMQEVGADRAVNLLQLYQNWEDMGNGLGTY